MLSNPEDMLTQIVALHNKINIKMLRCSNMVG
jgi:hypothetical protein